MFKILIADPDEQLATLYQRTLVGEGYIVEKTTSGLGCLFKLREFHPDLVILEADIPWGWGEGVLGVLSEEPLLPQVSVLLISENVSEKCIGVGEEFVKGRFDKPLLPGDLISLVQLIVEENEEKQLWAPWGALDKSLPDSIHPS